MCKPFHILLALLLLLATACGGEEEERPNNPVVGTINLTTSFGTHNKSLLCDPITDGYQMDIAWANEKWYLLTMQQSSTNDALYKINPTSGAIEQSWKYPIKYAAGITSDGTNLWILNRSTTPFLRRLNYDGTIQEEINAPSLPTGSEYGVAIHNGLFYFSSTDSGTSTVYSFNKTSGQFTTIFSLPEKIYALHAYNDKLYAFQYREDFYSKYWLYIYDLATAEQKKYNFLNEFVWGLANQDNMLYLMCRKSGSRPFIYPFKVLPEQKMIIGEPRSGNASVEYIHGTTNSYPFSLQIWLPDLRPQDITTSLQQITGFSLDSTPASTTKDASGNYWASYSWPSKTGMVTNKISFHMLTANSAHTPDVTASWSVNDYPASIYDFYTRETYCFDYSSSAVAQAAATIPAGSTMQRIMDIRKYVNDTLAIVGPSGNERKASEYLIKGEGRCYAHALCFAAIARKLGIPTRVVAGMVVASNGNILTDDPPVHTWNQVYLPDCGWVTFDIVNDDDPAGNHTLRNAAKSDHNVFFINFVGSFDQRNFTTCFVERSWISVYNYHSLDIPNYSYVRLRALNITWAED